MLGDLKRGSGAAITELLNNPTAEWNENGISEWGKNR